MRIVLRYLLVLILALFAAVNVAQDNEDGDSMLLINISIDNPSLCTRDQATSFYDELGAFQQYLEDLLHAEDEDAFVTWYGEYNEWYDTYWLEVFEYSCDGIDYWTRALDALINDSILAQLVGNLDELPEDNAMVAVLAVSEIDLEAMALDDDPEIDLEINRIVTDLPRCSDERAQTFYRSIDDYEKLTDSLAKEGLAQILGTGVLFKAWRNKAWAEFYKEPCGSVLPIIYYLESRTYIGQFMRVIGRDTSDYFAGLVQEWRDIAEYDLEIVNSRADV